MGKLKKFEIEFVADEKNDVGSFVAGQTINGIAYVELSRPIELRRIYVKLKGKAQVKWTEQYGKTTVVYHRKEPFFDTQIVVIGSDNVKMNLPAGLHEFPFSFTLPLDSASSFGADHGKVCYKVEGTIDRPWAIDDHVLQRFTVSGILDLNDPCYNDFTQPITAEITKDASGLFSSGTVSAKITLNRKCFVPGDTIFLSAEVFNNSNRNIEKIWVSVKQYILYHAQKTKRQSKPVLTTSKEEVILPGAVGTWLNVPVVIPELAPTNLAGRCSVLIVQYALKFYTSSGLKLSFPVVIGTVPLRNSADNCFPCQPPSSMIDMAPPSYAEANQTYWNPDEKGDSSAHF